VERPFALRTLSPSTLPPTLDLRLCFATVIGDVAPLLRRASLHGRFAPSQSTLGSAEQSSAVVPIRRGYLKAKHISGLTINSGIITLQARVLTQPERRCASIGWAG
jgi:hypothetical protein